MAEGKRKEEKEDEEISLDFGKIGSFFKNLTRGGKGEGNKEAKSSDKDDEDINFNFGKAKSFFSKYGAVLLILIPIFLSIYFRSYTYSMPITDEWAQSSVYSSIKNDISSQIDAKYPNLLKENRDALVEKEFQSVLTSQKAQIDEQIKSASEYFKQSMKDENGDTYLLEIDPYLWYGEARNYLQNGHFGTDIVNGTSKYMLRDGRRGKIISFERIVPFVEAWSYKVIKIFNSDISLMSVCFIMPLILSTLAVIPAFFLGRKFGGNIGGLFAGIIVAVNSSLLSRTPAGFSDTDSFQALFPLLALWAFFETFTADRKKRIIYSCLTGLAIGIYGAAWKGWWYVFDFLMVLLGVYLVYCLFFNKKEKSFLSRLRQPAIKDTFITMIILTVVTGILITTLLDFPHFYKSLTQPISFSEIKEVEEEVWPNVFTTVAEFNVSDWKEIISSMGGTFLMLIALFGALTTLSKKDEYENKEIRYLVLFVMWFVGCAYAFTKGSRFAMLLLPMFAVFFGTGIYKIYRYATKFSEKSLGLNIKIAKIIVILLLCLLLISPIKTAHAVSKSEVPLINDAWYEALTEIKNNSTEAMITSWWDFGHWFYSIAERHVTFDGADQKKKIFWVGKTLLTDNEKEAVGILRMLNCRQDDAYVKMLGYNGNARSSVNMLLNIIVLDRKKAKLLLKENGLNDEQSDEILKLTHCDNLMDHYFIVSEDMVGKAPVWAHFGSWDFRKAEMYDAVRGKDQTAGINILKENFSLSENDAFKYYYEIQKEIADKWVSPWPGYMGSLSSCLASGDYVACANGLIFNKTTNDAYFMTAEGMKNPQSIVYPIDLNGSKDLYVKKYFDNTIPVSANLIKIKSGNLGGFNSILMDPLLADSMFTRLFYQEGKGLEYFELFSYKQQFNGQKIYVYRVNFDKFEKDLANET